MFDIGFWELITIAILALIIVRPEKLPKFAKDAGKLLKNLRNYVKKTKNGGYVIFGRSEATLNPGGVRIGTGEIYSCLQKFHWIEDCLATGYLTKNDEKIVLFLKLLNTKINVDFNTILKKHLKTSLSPRHVPWKIFIVKDIPRTKSGKNSEKLVKKIINNDKVQNLGSLANPESVIEYRKININE